MPFTGWVIGDSKEKAVEVVSTVAFTLAAELSPEKFLAALPAEKSPHPREHSP
jgi:hypothetical protein